MNIDFSIFFLISEIVKKAWNQMITSSQTTKYPEKSQVFSGYRRSFLFVMMRAYKMMVMLDFKAVGHHFSVSKECILVVERLSDVFSFYSSENCLTCACFHICR